MLATPQAFVRDPRCVHGTTCVWRGGGGGGRGVVGRGVVGSGAALKATQFKPYVMQSNCSVTITIISF
jgi:hypothetical protein